MPATPATNAVIIVTLAFLSAKPPMATLEIAWATMTATDMTPPTTATS